jgi:hypothetical protein
VSSYNTFLPSAMVLENPAAAMFVEVNGVHRRRFPSLFSIRTTWSRISPNRATAS